MTSGSIRVFERCAAREITPEKGARMLAGKKRAPLWQAWALALGNLGALAWACVRSLRP